MKRQSEFARAMPSRPIIGDGWLKIEKLYDKYISDGIPKNELIPKKIHQVWIGESMPQKFQDCVNSVKKINHDYEYKLWTLDDVDEFQLKNRKLFDEVDNLGCKSDIFRYEILERYGGIYLDTDFIGLKSFDTLLGFELFGGTAYVEKPEVLNGLLGCIPNHPVMTECVNRLSKKQPKMFDRDAYGVIKFSGPWFFTEVFLDIIQEDSNALILPEKYFYSFPSKLRNQFEQGMINQYKTVDSFVSHLWGCSWQKK
jgi:mannosyltransferase OCH1-like enzyme